eukprot:6200613-Pleurochrysis_carterae.AAC.1
MCILYTSSPRGSGTGTEERRSRDDRPDVEAEGGFWAPGSVNIWCNIIRFKALKPSTRYDFSTEIKAQLHASIGNSKQNSNTLLIRPPHQNGTLPMTRK